MEFSRNLQIRLFVAGNSNK